MRAHRNYMACAAVLVALATVDGESRAAEERTTKIAEPFEGVPWKVDQWAKAEGSTKPSSDVPSDCDSKQSMEVEVRYSGTGFQWFSVVPSSPVVIPGALQRVTLRIKSSDPRCGMHLALKDGWGRGEADKKKFEWQLPIKEANRWTTVSFDVPNDWVKPVSIAAIGMHNWDFQNEQRSFRFWVDHVEVTTDISGVDKKTGLLRSWRPNPNPEKPEEKQTPPCTPLVSTEIRTPVTYGIFSGQAPSAEISVRNWLPGTLAGSAHCIVKDAAGRRILSSDRELSVEDTAQFTLPLEVEKFGLYTLDVELNLAGQSKRTEHVNFAKLPPYHKLTKEQKQASPYGINVHTGEDREMVVPFRDAGVVWFRDYGWSYDWLVRAKGSDKKYAGWPNYPKIAAKFADAEVMLLPCMMKGIGAPKEGAAPGPDKAWAREIADIVNAFPDVTHWELDNEYDLNGEYAKVEEKISWANYRAYHRRFAEILRALSDGALKAVENGRAGIWPQRARSCVQSGDFQDISVINTHHYCGIDAPETNFGNFNTGFEAMERDQAPALFFDRLRDVKKSALADGRERESWLTEFGWDTLAGFVVTPVQQAAYLPRSWMVAMAAGADKCFWFFHFDSPTPSHFFDGCGLLNPDGSPKLSLCAMAGLTQLLPTPRYVGSINAGADTQGYVFENGENLVASLWSISGENGPEVAFRSGQLHDYFGNKLDGKRAKLALQPLYVSGLSRADPYYLQTAYDLESPYLVVASAGEELTTTLRVRNNRSGTIRGKVKLELPDGWTDTSGEQSFSARRGDTKSISLTFTVDSSEMLGESAVTLVITEPGVVKKIPLRVLVNDPFILRVGSIFGRPGKSEITVKIGNRSAKDVDGTLRLFVPDSWKAHTPQQQVNNLKSGEIREVKISFDWTDTWRSGESARAVFATGKHTIERPIIPQAYRIHRARNIAIDGKLDEWDEKHALPGWMLGTSLGEANARVYLAWSEQGLTCAVKVGDSRLIAADPRSFWNGDCMEVFVDTSDRKTHRGFEVGDHQFWMVPQVDEGNVYVGRWKRVEEIPATQYGVKGVSSASRRDGDGYIMEFVIPASALQNYQPRVGSTIGLNLNITIKGARFDREVFWPATKADWPTANWPKMWSSMKLVD